ncbi:MAG: hypothetical protein IJA80_01865 [Clostridia bacterium]|nr:hypothetical protein [Clostridia bacterium]
MSNNIKKSFSIILILTMLISIFAINTSANNNEEENTIMPRFSTIDAVSTGFSISGINSTSSVSLTAKYSTSLYIKIELQKEKSTGYETIETWTKSGTGTAILLEEDRLINIFADYRIKVTCTAGGETHVTYDYPD